MKRPIGFISKCFLILVLLSGMGVVRASASDRLNLDLRNASLPDAIRLIAGSLQRNVIISTSVTGTVTLHLTNALPDEALNLILVSNGLAEWQSGNVWLVAPKAELIKRKQEEVKWQLLTDETEPLEEEIFRVQYGKAADIAKLFQEGRSTLISKRGQIRVDERTNILYIRDIPPRIAALRHLMASVDVPVRQLSIEARLASIDSDFERELGVDFTLKTDDEAGANNPSALSANGRYSLAVAKLADGSLLDIKLAALENDGHAEVISRPSLFTANQQSASLEAGEEIPYQEVSESGGTAIVFKKAVLGLKATPQLLPGNKVLLHLEINQDRPSTRMVLGVPAITTRQIKTSVLVNNGQTVVLGGIYETNYEREQKRLPFLSRMPLVGELFKQETRRENKRELLIFVTPKIIAS